MRRKEETGMSKKTVCLFAFLVFGSVLALSARAAEGNSYVIKAKKIYTVSQGVVENGTIIVEKGKIVQLGKDISVPKGLPVLEADVIIPGLVDAHTHVGVYSLPNVEENSDGNEMTNPVTPQVRALDSFNFDDPAIQAGLAGGVTTVISRPGSGNVIGGTSVAVKLKNASPQEMVLKEVCDLKMAIEGNPIGVYGSKNQMPGTLMSVYFLARKAFIEAQEYAKSLETYEKEKKEGKDVPAPKRDLGKEALGLALKREIPVHMHCATASEIMTCIRLAEEFNLKLSLGHCYWAYLIVDELAKHKDVHYNVGPPMFFNYFEDPLTFKNNPAILSEAGLKVSLQTDALGGAQQNLRHLALLCVRYGMKEEDALRSVTLNGAEAVGLEARIGSIAPGKDADLVFLDGEPFDILTSVRQVLVDGRVEYKNPAGLRPSLAQSVASATTRLVLPEGLEPDAPLAIKAGTIFPVSGPAFNGGVILIEKGKIKSIGKDIPVPAGVPVVDAREFTIMPGLVSARSHVGITSNWRMQSSVNEPSKSVVPELEVKHAVEPQAPLFTFARELGITSVMVTPGDRNVMGGQGAVLKTEGSVVDRMIIKERSIMVFGIGASAKRKDQLPSTRMGIAALLRETLVKAAEYRSALEKYEQEKKGKEPQRDLSLEALLPVLRGEMPVLIHCERRDDILTALRLADEFKLKVVLDGATDAYKVVDDIKKRGIAVVLEDIFRGAGNIEDRGFNPQNAALLAKAGILIAFRPAEGSWYVPGAGEAGGDLLETAAFEFKNGLPEAEALRAVTLNAARIAGMEARIGSLEPGKDADLLILRGHPLSTGSVPEAVFIDGRPVYVRKEGARLGKGL
jgi:imidazolonepropionase-like amidohydrolase